MPIGDQHIAKSFDQQLHSLDALLGALAGLVETQLDQGLAALSDSDHDLAAQVIQGDHQVDEYRNRIEEQSLQVLALRAPVANDLRRVITAIKVAGEMERIADLAANIAKRSMILDPPRLSSTLRGVVNLGRVVQDRLHETVNAYRDMNVDSALAVRERDDEVDALYSGLFREILTYMMEDPRTITDGSHLLFVAKNLERIGDHATNIAEMTVFQVTGRALSDERPKGDTSAQA